MIKKIILSNNLQSVQLPYTRLKILFSIKIQKETFY